MEELDLETLRNKKIIKIGELTPDIINILGLNDKPRNIMMWADILEHCEKHKCDFESEQDYLKTIKSIPTIVQNPDYVGLHPDGKSIQYIKKITDNCIVGITTNSLSFRTIYPIKESKLNNYIDSNRVHKINKEGL